MKSKFCLTLALAVSLSVNSSTVVYAQEYNETGWFVTEDGNWCYYKDGQPVKGWIKDGENWYYLQEAEHTTVMLTGWQLIEEKWYYFQP